MPIPREIPCSKQFSAERVADMTKYSDLRLTALIRGLREIRETKISQWRKIYNGTPREKTKNFPWENASNVVVQLVASFSDQLVAKIVMGTLGLDPIWDVDIAGEWSQKDDVEAQREAAQGWLAYCALEPSLLNIIPKYTVWTRTIVKYGFGAIKLLPELDIEQVVSSMGESGKPIFSDYERHNGPVVLPIQFEDFLMPANTCELERIGFLAQRAVLEKWDVQNLLHDPSYDRSVLREVLKNPTRTGPSKTQRELEDQTGAKTDSSRANEQWDFYECWFKHTVGGKKFHIIETKCADPSGENSKTVKTVFNWLPENDIPYVGGRLGSDGERAYGFGFCEMLKDYQEEVSAIHNRRGDAATAANTNIFRIDSGTQLDQNFSIYPMATIPGAKDSFEVIPLGRSANETIKDEQIVLQEAQDRVGIGPSSSGQGAGTVNKKGAYSAMGTFAVMQEGNARPNLTVTEFRVSHYQVGRKVMLYDSHFGIPTQILNAFGKQKEALQKSFENYKARKINLPIRAATGSVNKEIEKQNLMLLLNNMRAHWQMVSQLLAQASNPMAPPDMMNYLYQVILCSNMLMKKITKDFGIPDPSSVLPEPLGVKEKIDQLERKFMELKQQQAAAEEAQKKRQLTAGSGGEGGPAGPGGQGGKPQLPQPQAPGAPGMGTGEGMAM